MVVKQIKLKVYDELWNADLKTRDIGISSDVSIKKNYRDCLTELYFSVKMSIARLSHHVLPSSWGCGCGWGWQWEYTHTHTLTQQAAMIEWLCCLARTTKVRCSNLDATRHRVTLDKSLIAVSLGSLGRCILITCDIRRSLWLVGVCGELKWFGRGTLVHAGLLSRATTSSSCRKDIRLSKLSPNSPYTAR
jgi:hypothetical protein